MDPAFTMPYLESLSTAELAALAGRNGIDVPAGLDRVFIIGELLEAVPPPPAEVPAPAVAEGAWELAELPGQYGISYVDVLVRDPLWVFAFWEAKPGVLETSGGEYCLRVVPLSEGDFRPDPASSFTVAVGPGDRSLYLGINPEEGRLFRIDLCSVRGGETAVIAESRPFRMPEVPDAAAAAATAASRLAVLSGAGRFPLALGADRIPRRAGA